MQTLAEGRFDSLQSLTITFECWFSYGKDGCLDSLVTLIARQYELKLLDLRSNYFTEEHE